LSSVARNNANGCPAGVSPAFLIAASTLAISPTTDLNPSAHSALALVKATGRDVSSRVTAEASSGTPGGGLQPDSAGVDGAAFALTPGETGAGMALPAAPAAAWACAKAGRGGAATLAKNRPKARQ